MALRVRSVPGFGDVLGDRQISDLANYLRTQFAREDLVGWGLPKPSRKQDAIGEPDDTIMSRRFGEAPLTTLTVNGESQSIKASPDTPLLYVLETNSGSNGEVRLRTWPGAELVQ